MGYATAAKLFPEISIFKSIHARSGSLGPDRADSAFCETLLKICDNFKRHPDERVGGLAVVALFSDHETAKNAFYDLNVIKLSRGVVTPVTVSAQASTPVSVQTTTLVSTAQLQNQIQAPAIALTTGNSPSIQPEKKKIEAQLVTPKEIFKAELQSVIKTAPASAITLNSSNPENMRSVNTLLDKIGYGKGKKKQMMRIGSVTINKIPVYSLDHMFDITTALVFVKNQKISLQNYFKELQGTALVPVTPVASVPPTTPFAVTEPVSLVKNPSTTTETPEPPKPTVKKPKRSHDAAMSPTAEMLKDYPVPKKYTQSFSGPEAMYKIFTEVRPNEMLSMKELVSLMISTGAWESTGKTPMATVNGQFGRELAKGEKAQFKFKKEIRDGQMWYGLA